MSKIVYKLTLGETVNNLLLNRAREERISESEVIKRALAVYDMLRAQTVGGRKISITNQADEVIADVELP